MDEKELNKLLSEVYLALLKHPHDQWRVENQYIYCRVRDSLAEISGLSAREVHETFEGLANL